MRLVRAALLACVLFGGCRAGWAAEFKAVDLPDGGGPGILISGVIRPGDEAAFHAVAARLSRATVITTGPGGAVGAALDIGTETRNRGWTTLVPPDTSCASACSMIWLAGTQRMLGANARIGFHAMALIQQGQRMETHDMDYLLRQWLNGLGYSLDATATIVNTHAASIRWYDTIELNANAIPTENYP